MKQRRRARVGAAVGVLTRMKAWEVDLVLNLRLWYAGPGGHAQVWNEYRQALHAAGARQECHAFETLIRTVIAHAQRPPDPQPSARVSTRRRPNVVRCHQGVVELKDAPESGLDTCLQVIAL